MESNMKIIRKVLIVLVGAYMVIGGLDAVTGMSRGFVGLNIDIASLFGGSGRSYNTLTSWIQIAAGALLIFRGVTGLSSLDKFIRIVILVIWAFLMIFGLFLGGALQGITTLQWWSALVNSGIILCVLLIIQ